MKGMKDTAKRADGFLSSRFCDFNTDCIKNSYQTGKVEMDVKAFSLPGP